MQSSDDNILIDSDEDQPSVSEDEHILDPSISGPSIPVDTDMSRGYHARRLRQLRYIAKHESALKQRNNDRVDSPETLLLHSKTQKKGKTKKKKLLPETRPITTCLLYTSPSPRD